MTPAAVAKLRELARALSAPRPNKAAWEAARKLVAELAAELRKAPTGEPSPLGRARDERAARALVDAIGQARSPEQLQALLPRIAAAVAEESLTPSQGHSCTTAIQRALVEQRQQPALDERGPVALLHEDAADVAEVYEGILDARRRRAARAAVERLAVEDAAAFPSDLRATPGALPSAVAAAGLDPWGDAPEEVP